MAESQISNDCRTDCLCYVCAGGDPECEYCRGTGNDPLTMQERSYRHISRALSRPRRTYLSARIRYIRRLISRPVRKLANWISDDDVSWYD